VVVDVGCDVVYHFVVTLDIDSVLFIVVSFHLTFCHGYIFFGIGTVGVIFATAAAAAVVMNTTVMMNRVVKVMMDFRPLGCV